MKQRILTALIALIILAPIIIYGNWPFIIIAYVLSTIALFELIRMYEREKAILYVILSSLFLWSIIYPSTEITINNFGLTKFDIIVLFVVILLTLTVLSKNRFTFDKAGFLLLATVYIGTAVHFLIVTRLVGLNFLLFILFVIWATDSGAYFIGKRFGKRKLWPEISPNKTIGGAIGGIITALVVGTFFQLIYPFEKPFILIVVVTMIISIFGQIGDLVASAIKRHFDVKDSGKIFPGHGGILDRFDSLFFVLIVLHILQFT